MTTTLDTKTCRSWTGTIHRRDCIYDPLHLPLYGEGVYTVVTSTPAAGSAVGPLTVWGVQSPAYRDVERQADRLGYPMGRLGTITALLRAAGIDALYAGHGVLVVLNRTLLQKQKAA